MRNLIAWGQLAGVPIVGLSKNEEFFRKNLHIIPRDNPIVESLDDYTIEAACYTPQDVYLEYSHKTDRQRSGEIRKNVTDSIKTHVVYYHPSENIIFIPGDEEFNQTIRQENRENYKKRSESDIISPKICYDFLSDYLLGLEKFPDFYIHQVIMGIRSLPKRIVNLMKGRAIYLSQGQGPSMTIHTASNVRKIDYLGLIPGVFLERQGSDDHVLHARLIHEIGHLIHQTVILERFFDSTLGISSLQLFPNSEEFRAFSTELESLFKEERGLYNEEDNITNFQQKLPNRLGFITYYSLKNREEDFAEVFRYYILHNKYLFSTATNRQLQRQQKPRPDKTLLVKYRFMEQLIGKEGIETGKDVTDISKYGL